MLLQGGFTSVLQAKNRDELLAEVVGFTRRLGFETVTATAVVDRSRGDSDFVWIDNTPSAYRQLSETVEEGRRDPVGQHCRKASVPITWNQDTYTSIGLGEKWEAQARFG